MEVASAHGEIKIKMKWKFPKSWNVDFIYKIPFLNWILSYFEQDSIDVSCLIYKGLKLDETINCNSPPSSNKSIELCAPKPDISTREGVQKLTVNLKIIHPDVTSIFFCLSCRASPSLCRFGNPVCEFETKTCKITEKFEGVQTEAFVLCSFSRKSHGYWDVDKLSKPSSGKVGNYGGLEKTIKNVLDMKCKKTLDVKNETT